MRISKWGNSLAIRLPAKLVAALSLNEGDELSASVKGKGKLELQAKKRLTTEQLETMLRPVRRRLPQGFKFNREEANER